jgi:DNA-binding CsgD family transcriptional regulator
MTRKADPARVADLAAEGYSQSTIATMLGVSRERIRQICSRDGIVTLPGNRNYDREAKLLAIVQSGARMTAKEAAIAAGYSGTSTSSIFPRLGVAPPRPVIWADRYRECAEAGMTLTETARQFGKPRSEVWNECRRKGITFSVKYRRSRPSEGAAA